MSDLNDRIRRRYGQYTEAELRALDNWQVAPANQEQDANQPPQMAEQETEQGGQCALVVVGLLLLGGSTLTGVTGVVVSLLT